MNESTSGKALLFVRIVVGLTASAAGIAGFFWLAGDPYWIRGWVFIGLMLVCQSAIGIHLKRVDPELVSRRGRPGEGTKNWDKALLSLFGTAYLAIPVVAALDAGRYHWSPAMPEWLMWVGIALYIVGAFFAGWAMSVNTHFEKTVRIQTDRSHRVIDTGPYGVVRHPGYLATIVGWLFSAPLILESWHAFIPAAAAAAVMTTRTALEDRLLRCELEGYADYAARVRYRLFPGLW